MQQPNALAGPYSLTPPAAWRYQEVAGRDERVDVLRGLAILAVIINHVALRSLYQIVSVEAIGVVTGAEAFVLLSGVIIGLVYRGRIERDGWLPASRKILSRAAQIYLIALVANLAVYLLQWLPGIDVSVLSAWTDPQTGERFSLYGDSPAPATFIAKMLLLSYGAGQINVLGLYVALLALTPVLLWLLQHRLGMLLIGTSWLIYGLNAAHPLRALPFQSENAFPLLAWQVLFVHGLVAGYYRERLQELLSGRPARFALPVLFALLFGFCFYALNNPWNDIPGPTRLSLIPEGPYGWLYATFFQRTLLGLGRILNTFVVVAALYALLTYCWAPLRRLASAFFIPLGQATLYIFVVHLLFVLIVHNLPLLQRDLLVVNTIAHTIVVAAIWLMVRHRVLFWLIPR